MACLAEALVGDSGPPSGWKYFTIVYPATDNAAAIVSCGTSDKDASISGYVCNGRNGNSNGGNWHPLRLATLVFKASCKRKRCTHRCPRFI